MDIKKIGKTIAELRKNKNLSQQELATLLNVSNKTVSKWECGNSTPDIEALEKIAKMFNLTIDELVNYKDGISQSEKSDNQQKEEQISKKKKLNKKAIISSCIFIGALILSLCFVFVPRSPVVKNYSNFEVDEENSKLYYSVGNDVERFSFDGMVRVPLGNTWGLYRDLNATSPINSKTVDLKVGDNNYYIVVENSVGNKKTYDVTVRRKPIYTVIIDYGDSQNVERVEEGSYINEPQAPTREGCVFDGWGNTFPIEVTSNCKITAKWSYNTDTPYKIEYYLQNLENDEYVLHETDNMSGTTGTEISAFIKPYSGFTYNKSYSTVKGTINGNGSLVLKVYYIRETKTVNSSFGGTISGKGTYKYGQMVRITANSYLGYDFLGWYASETLVSTETSYQYTVTDNIIARFVKKSELLPFNIEATENTCTITKVNTTASIVSVPSCVTAIAESAFKNNATITTISLPNSLLSIGKNAFYNCTALEKVYINDIKYWLRIDFENAYSSPMCNNATLYVGGKQLTDVSIPNEVTNIKKYAFYRCKTLNNVQIHSNVETVGVSAFAGCIGLSSIIIPESVSSIDSFAFSGCTSLISVGLPYNLTKISSNMFSGCTSLRCISLPISVVIVGEKAFLECENLEWIELPSGIMEIGNQAFNNCKMLKKVYYKGNATRWNEIDMGYSNSSLTYNAIRYYYNETKPESQGKYYHYDSNGNIAIWIYE